MLTRSNGPWGGVRMATEIGETPISLARLRRSIGAIHRAVAGIGHGIPAARLVTVQQQVVLRHIVRLDAADVRKPKCEVLDIPSSACSQLPALHNEICNSARAIARLISGMGGASSCAPI